LLHFQAIGSGSDAFKLKEAIPTDRLLKDGATEPVLGPGLSDPRSLQWRETCDALPWKDHPLLDFDLSS
jgi:hypothetical protein